MSRIETLQKYHHFVDQCDHLVKEGKVSEVISLLSNMNLAQVPREVRQALASVCRRAGLVHQGLRLLSPLIYGPQGNTAPATPGEICEYAVLLSRNGSLEEALGLLQTVDPTATPEAFLYSGFCRMMTWEVAEAAENFKMFISSSEDSYSQLIARVNLVSCFILLTQLKEASAVLDEIMPKMQALGAHRLLGNCHGLRAQIHFWQNDFSSARRELRQAADLLGKSPSHDQLLIVKYESIMAAFEQKSTEPLWLFSQEATRRRHWDSVRDAGLFALMVRFDQQHFDHLIHGTMRSAYRDRALRLIGRQPSPSYIMGSGDWRVLDIESGRISDGGFLPPGKKIHQTILALTQDFYSPLNMATLFSLLYPGEPFDLDSSPVKVRQMLRRTRQWCHENKIPVVISHADGAYRLSLTGNFGIKKTLSDSAAVSASFIKWQELLNAFPPGIPFQIQDACQKMQWSRSAFHRWAEWALQFGVLRRTKKGRAVVYKLLSEPSSADAQKTA